MGEASDGPVRRQEALLHPQQQQPLAEAGFARVRQEFSMQGGIDKLMERLDCSLGAHGR